MNAIADSQYAMARILHAIGDVAEQDPPFAAKIATSMPQIADLQASMTEVMSSLGTLQSGPEHTSAPAFDLKYLRPSSSHPNLSKPGPAKPKKRKKQVKPLMFIGVSPQPDKKGTKHAIAQGDDRS
jgi:hypothetical protein